MSSLQLRPLGFGETLDAGFTIYRRSFLTLFLTALLPLVPVIAFWLLIAALVGTGSETALIGLVGVVMMYQWIATPVTWAALIYLVGRAVTAERLSIGDAYRHGLRRFFAFVVGGILFSVLVGVGFMFLVVPGILLGIMCFAVLSVIVIEGKGPIRAIGRSRNLARGAYGRIAGIYIVATLITMLPMSIVWTGVGFMTAFQPTVEASLAVGGAMYAVSQVLTYVINALTLPFSTAVFVLLYFDRRVRVEGFGLEMPGEPVADEAATVMP